MGKFQFEKTAVDGVLLITPTVFGDDRGYFMETYQQQEFEAAGIVHPFVQCNQSKSKQGVLRGLHFQIAQPQGKLVRVIEGAVFDVAVDIRKNSPTYGKWVGVVLSQENKQQLFVPRGLAHGFYVLTETAEFTYMCDAFYDATDEGGLLYNDETVNVQWPILPNVPLLLSEKDKKHPTLHML